jgi:hypothetical protein
LSKYKAAKSVINGITFDSRAEARRYSQLLFKNAHGEIQNLELQPVFVLAPSVKLARSTRAKPALRYRADFRYTENGQVFVEDVKGMLTPEFKIKEHLMKSLFDIDLRIVK